MRNRLAKTYKDVNMIEGVKMMLKINFPNFCKKLRGEMSSLMVILMLNVFKKELQNINGDN